MMSRHPIARTFVTLLVAAAAARAARGEDWPAWRGPTALGVSSEKGLPVRFSPTEGVAWKVPLPAPGNSTPVIVGKRIFLTQATAGGKRRALLALDRRDGRVLWEKAVEYPDREPTHEDNPYCSASPVCGDGIVVVSHGSAGVFAYDFEGKELWRRDLGKFHHIWGNASSPVLSGALCYLNCGPGPRSSLMALEAKSGKTAWQVEVPGGLEGGDAGSWTGSWSTPLLIRSEGRNDLLISYPHQLLAVDPASGHERWSCAGLGRLVYTSPITGEGVIVAMSGFGGPALAARAGGQGDVTATHRLWHEAKAPQRIGSGIITGGHLYFINEPGIGECRELESGKVVWKERVCGTTWSSPILADGNFYIIDQDGETQVFRAATRFERIASSHLHELTRASIAVSDGRLFIRTYKHLWCIGPPYEAP
jgi:outer membrane protein assembly factor BamB